MQLSIITVTYNSEDVISRCINSVLMQKKTCEYVIVDGNSSDQTFFKISKYRKYINSFISENDHGIYDAMNKGIRIASGDIIGFINSDDFYDGSNIFSTIIKTFENSSCDSCYGDLVYVDQRYRPVRYWKAGPYLLKKFYWGWMPPHPTFFVKKEIFEKYGGFDTSFGTAADYELMLRFLLKHKISCTYIPRVLVCMQTGGVSNASLKGRFEANRSDLAAWEKNGLRPYRYTSFCKPARKIYQFSALLRSSCNV